MVRKILRYLPKNKWRPKVTAIEEAQDLKTLALDDLLGKLLTHEVHRKEDEEEIQPKKGVAFKTTSKEHYSSKDNSSEEDEDSMAMIAQGLKKIFKSKIFDPKKFHKKGSFSKKNKKLSKGNKPLNNKNESNPPPCLSCGLPGHVVKNGPILQKKAKKLKQKAKEEFKNAMIAT